MKTFRLAFLLGILSTSLVGCNNGGGDNPGKIEHTVSFAGENCFLRKETGEQITEPIKVEDGSTANYVIYVKDTAKYAVPDNISVEGTVEYTYPSGRKTVKEATLKLSNIKSDVVITAKARDISNLCIVSYYSDDTCEWHGDNPGSIQKGTTLTARIDIDSGTVKNFTVLVGEEILTDGYSYSNGVFTLGSSYTTANIVLYAHAETPSIDKYQVEFAMEHATATFPTEEWQGIPLSGKITADEGYRVPTIEELAPTGRPIDGTIRKIKTGVDHHLTQDQFSYTTYIDENGRSVGELYIHDIIELLDAEKIIIGGIPIKQVSVTFQVGKGHWPGGSGTDVEDRVGTIDINDYLENAEEKAGANQTPIVDKPGVQFKEWQDADGKPYYSQTKVEGDLVLHATFAPLECVFYTEDVINAEITGLPEKVSYHAAVSSVTITAKNGCKLPMKKDVSVTMLNYDTEKWEDIFFAYEITDASQTTASFSIGANIIEGDIKIALTAAKYVSVSFNSGEGIWPKTKKSETLTATVPTTYTYNQAFDSLYAGGHPEIVGRTFIGWENSSGAIINMNTKVGEVASQTLTAYFNEYVSFAEDTWENVIKYADSGTLEEAYNPAGKPSSLYIGAERYIEYDDSINNVTKRYKVRLIDRGYDRYKKDGVVTASQLTFEFEELVGSGEYGHYQGEYSTQNSNNWFKSTYRSWLNNTFYPIIVKSNKGFEAKPAIKYTLQGRVESGDPAALVTTEDPFFAMSGAEIGIAESNLETQTNPTTYPESQRLNEGVDGGAYYWYNQPANSRLKKLDGANKEYWLRSPHVYKEIEPENRYGSDDYDTGDCYYIKDTGGTSIDYKGGVGAGSFQIKGYMAAFCI